MNKRLIDKHLLFGTWIFVTTCVLSLFVSILWQQTLIWNQFENNDHTSGLIVYWVVVWLVWISLNGMLWYTRGQTWSEVGRAACWIIILVALACRVAVVCGTQPVLSDDIWRYIHDGAMLGNGANPYVLAPAEIDLADAPVPGVMARVNNAELVTIYQPTSQYIFAGLDRYWEWCSPQWQSLDSDHDKVFRLGFVLFDMAVIGLILLQLRSMGRSAWWATAYAWHPLVISEVAGSGHQESVGIAFLLLAWAAASRLSKGDGGEPIAEDDVNRPAWGGWLLAIGAGVAFGLAVAVKPVVLPLALVLAWSLRRLPKHIALAAGATVLTGVAIYLPFILMDGGVSRMIDTAQTFVDKWSFNGSAYDVVTRWIVGKPWIDYLAIAVLLAVIVVTSLQRHGNAARSAGAFLFASLLISSTVHPWYLMWALAFLPLYFSPALWVFSLTIVASYAAHLYPGYRVPAWVVMGEYLPVYAVLVWGAWRWVRGRYTEAGISKRMNQVRE
jgi:alpha-1,6-mannosyltransferase